MGSRDHRPALRDARPRPNALSDPAPAGPRDAVRDQDAHVRSGSVPLVRLDARSRGRGVHRTRCRRLRGRRRARSDAPSARHRLKGRNTRRYLRVLTWDGRFSVTGSVIPGDVSVPNPDPAPVAPHSGHCSRVRRHRFRPVDSSGSALSLVSADGSEPRGVLTRVPKPRAFPGQVPTAARGVSPHE